MDIEKYVEDNYTQDRNGYITSYAQLNKYFEQGKIVRVAKYGRCSSDEQKKNGYTIGDQLALLDDFAEEHKLITYNSYVDEGISATLEIHKRKALAQLIEDAKAGKFDVIIFKCIDRFFRNVGEYYECQKQLSRAGVTWLSIEEADLNPDDPDAAFKINIYLAMAEYEAKKTSKRIRFNNKMRIKNKQVVTGSQCFHFPWHVVGEPRNRHLARNMERAEELYDLLDYFEMHQSKNGAIEYYNNKYNKDMVINTLNNLLTDTLLYGEYKGVPNYVEPYISKERFDHIQDILKSTAKYNRSSNSCFLFTGLISCPRCGFNLSGNTYVRPHTVGYSYRCNGHRQRKTCSFNLAVNERTIEAQLVENLERYAASALVEVQKVEPVKKGRPKKSQVESLKKEMDRLNTMYRKGRIDDEEYDRDYLELENKLKIAEIEEGEQKPRDVSHLKDILSTDWRGLYNQLDRPHKKAFWRKLVKKMTIGEDKKIIEESIKFF